MILIQNADIYAPSRLGRKDLLMAGGSIIAIEPAGGLDDLLSSSQVEVFDAEGMTAVPGFIDNHLHLIGGGGEGGYTTRTPEMMLGDMVAHGVTSVVGTLGTDATSRSMADLLAKVKALREEGIGAWCWSGNYHLPVKTLTGNLTDDIMLIEEVIGAGEIAVSDHRSSQPTVSELARLASQVRVGGMLSGKAGLVNLHLGDGKGGLELLRELIGQTDIPISQFLPTHLTRNPGLFSEAIDWALQGGRVDFTACTVQSFLDDGEIRASDGFRRMLDAGVDPRNITFSSDAGGSLPEFDSRGELIGMSIGSCSSLYGEIKRSVTEQGIDLETALLPVSANPAATLGLKGKGRLEVGFDADIVLLDGPADRGEAAIHSVFARGRAMVRAGELLVRSRFESR